MPQNLCMAFMSVLDPGADFLAVVLSFTGQANAPVGYSGSPLPPGMEECIAECFYIIFTAFIVYIVIDKTVIISLGTFKQRCSRRGDNLNDFVSEHASPV